MHEIREKFVHEFMHEFVHEFMPEDYVFKEKIWGKSISIINITCVEFHPHGQTERYCMLISSKEYSIQNYLRSCVLELKPSEI